MNIIILIEAFDQLQFFKKFKKWFEKSDIYPTIITDKLSIYINLKLTSRFNICLLNQDSGKVDVPDLNSTFEVLTNQISINKGKLLYSSVYTCAESLIKNNRIAGSIYYEENEEPSVAGRNCAFCSGGDDARRRRWIGPRRAAKACR